MWKIVQLISAITCGITWIIGMVVEVGFKIEFFNDPFIYLVAAILFIHIWESEE